MQFDLANRDLGRIELPANAEGSIHLGPEYTQVVLVLRAPPLCPREGAGRLEWFRTTTGPTVAAFRESVATALGEAPALAERKRLQAALAQGRERLAEAKLSLTAVEEKWRRAVRTSAEKEIAAAGKQLSACAADVATWEARCGELQDATAENGLAAAPALEAAVRGPGLALGGELAAKLTEIQDDICRAIAQKVYEMVETHTQLQALLDARRPLELTTAKLGRPGYGPPGEVMDKLLLAVAAGGV